MLKDNKYEKRALAFLGGIKEIKAERSFCTLHKRSTHCSQNELSKHNCDQGNCLLRILQFEHFPQHKKSSKSHLSLLYFSLNLILQQKLTICSSLKVTLMVPFHTSSFWISVIIQDCSNIISFRNSSLLLSPLGLLLAVSLPILQSISHSYLVRHSITLLPSLSLSLSKFFERKPLKSRDYLSQLQHKNLTYIMFSNVGKMSQYNEK